MKRKWKLNIIHLSHTDIGYTDTQERIITNQVTYLHELVAKYNKKPNEFTEWKYNCESFFIVEKFLKEATEEEKKTFDSMVKQGIVGITGSFFNICELANENLYGAILDREFRIAKDFGWKIKSTICDDVNGFSIGYANQLAEHKIENLFFGLHTHHGMYPCFKKQSPFWWEVQPGKKILTWVGEQYLVGNELGLADGHVGSYVLHLKDMTMSKPEKFEDQIRESANRIREYLMELDKSGYEFTNVPITVLGDGGDNAQWNLAIKERLEFINKELSNEGVSLEMVTVDRFFENIRKEKVEIPTYHGDWPDWWTDGTGSTPNGTRIFKQAQRNYELIKRLKIESELQDELEEMLFMYAEHTWAAWSSIENPFEFWTQEISAIKASYAARALAISTKILDKYTGRKSVHRPGIDEKVVIKFEVPFKNEVKICTHLKPFLTGPEMDHFAKGFKVMQNGKEVPSFVVMTYYMQIPQPQLYAVVDMSKGDTEIEISSKQADLKNYHRITWPTDIMGADRITDVYNPLVKDEVIVSNKTIENDFVKISWDEFGIKSLYSKSLKKELIDQEQEGLFTPVYELSPIPYEFEQMNLRRRWTGRNRKRMNTQKFVGKIDYVNVVSDNKDYVIVEFFFKVEGTRYYKLLLQISNDARTIEATVQMIKETEWSLQNFYISLPFAKHDSKVLFDKGRMLEIWKDQLPGSLIDYYSIQEGIEIKSGDKTAALISTPDNNLFWTGPMDYQKRFLAHDARNTNRPCLYAWVLNNAWETNFNADPSGFHEFKYTIYLPKNNKESLNNLKVLNKIYISKRK